jgi:alpha 1,2-mannosyltransferase
MKTIPTLWKTVWEFIDSKGLREKLPKDSALSWVSNDGGKSYNRCHFWSNFEIASLDLWRDPQYLEFFDYLDKSGGFFYERWGDAPVHTIYAALFLKREEIHFFNDIGYIHDGVIHCPREEGIKEKCHCDAGYRVVTHNEDHSCVPAWLKLKQSRELFSFDKFN